MVATVARPCGAPYKVLAKQRLWDTSVRITIPDLSSLQIARPGGRHGFVGSDDDRSGSPTPGKRPVAPTCIAVHALFTLDAFARLQDQAA